MGKDGGVPALQKISIILYKLVQPLRKKRQDLSAVSINLPHCLAGTKSGRVLQRVISAVFVWMIIILAHKYFFNE